MWRGSGVGGYKCLQKGENRHSTESYRSNQVVVSLVVRVTSSDECWGYFPWFVAFSKELYLYVEHTYH